MRWILGLTLVVLVVFLAGFGLSCSPKGYTGSVESITVAYSPFESTALLWVAQDQGFFSRNGINITLRKYDTGSVALDGMVKGEADIAVGIAEFPVIRKAFEKDRIRIIGNIDKADFIYLVGRADRGIAKLSDIKGKRIGTTLGTVAHFHLGRLLTINGMSMQDITLVDVKTPEEWINAVVKGDIDAVVTAQPYADYAAERLGANAVVLSAQNNQYIYGLVVSSEDWIIKHPQPASRFLKSLVQAERYLKQHPTEAKTIVQKGLDLPVAYMETVWAQNQFLVSLDQTLILAMEFEARWMISNNLTTEKAAPNFLDFIYSDILKAVQPNAVRISGK